MDGSIYLDWQLLARLRELKVKSGWETLGIQTNSNHMGVVVIEYKISYM